MFKADTPITILRPGPPEDGARPCAEIPAAALKCDHDLRGTDDPAAGAYRTVFLVPPPALPQIGDSIVCAGRTYLVKSVRLCRDLDGKVVAARCTAE